MDSLALVGLVLTILIIIGAFSQGILSGLITLLVLGGTLFAVMYYLTKKAEERLFEKQQIEKNVNQRVDRETSKLDFSIGKRIDDVNHSERYKFIAIDEMKRKISFVESGKYRVYSYSDILESKIIEDGKEVTTTSRSSQIGRALIGGVIAGGVGAIIGGGGATQTQSNEVKKITLRIVVNDINNPYFELEFLENKTNTYIKKDTYRYEEAIKKANEWQNIISILIKQADDIDRKHREENSEVAVTKEDTFVGDELEKLASLRDKGILSEEEFQVQKKKLLNL